ncbi:MAG: hypothetical protein GVY26_07020 [Bacteroidetes bacterium]|nr:hypothetical protein [Bacteroidota bacterium]
MVKSTLVELLKTFSAEDWKRFELFLKSPYFNRSKLLLRLFRFLQRFRPALDSHRLTKERAFAAVYGKKAPYRESKVNDLMYSLKGLAETFLAHQELEVQPDRMKQQLALSLARRPVPYPVFEKAARQAVDAVEQQPESLDKHWALLWLHQLMYHHLDRPAAHDAPPQDLHRAMEELDQLYLYGKFRYSTELLSRHRYLEEEPDIFLLHQCLKAVGNGVEHHYLAKLHYWLVRLYSDESNEEAYQQAKGLLQRHLRQIGPVEKMSAYLILLNHTIRRSNAGQESWAREMLEWHKLGLSEGFLFQRGQILASTFINIVINAAALKEFAFASTFIAKYQAYLKPEEREEAMTMSSAYLFFHQCRYAEANVLLQRAPDYSIAFKIRAYSLQLRCLYEFYREDGSYQAPLLSACNRFSYYLKNDANWAASKKKAYHHFIVLLKKIVKYREDRDKTPKKRHKLKNTLEHYQPLSCKEWLQEKVGELP